MIKARKIYAAGLSTALLIILSSCQSELSESTGKGALRLNMSVKPEIETGSITKGGETQLGVPSLNEFTVVVFRDGAEVIRLDRFSEYQGDIELPKGNYSVNAYYGDIQKEGFDVPYFEGIKDFVIVSDQSTSVDVECALANSVITLEYSDTFRKYFSDYLTTIKTASGNTFLIESEEDRFAYVKPGKISATMELTRQGGANGFESLKLQVVNNENVEAKNHYNFKFDVDAGGEMLEIAFDDNVKLQPIDINTINAPAPEFVLSGFQSGDVYELAECSEKDMSVLISANNGIAGIKLTAGSAFLQSFGVPAGEIELTDLANRESVEIMNRLGLSVRGLENIDKMVELDFSAMIPALRAMGESNSHSFRLSVTDKFGKTCDDVDFVINSMVSTLNLEKGEAPVYIGSDGFAAFVDSDGDISKVKFSIEENGEWKPVNSFVTMPLTDGYNVVFDYMLGVDDIRVKAELGSTVRIIDFAVEVPEYSLSLLNDYSVWATKATLRLSVEDSSLLDNVLRFIKLTSNGATADFSVNGDVITLNGLNPDTQFEIVASCKDGQEDSNIALVTEKALQVPNADMEDWYYTRPAKVNYWEVWYASSEGEAPVWGTLNQKTTSEGGSNTSVFSNRNGCRYCSNSGTIKTSDANSGGAAALIRAVGWGSGNSAVGSANAKYGDCGYLYLGSYNGSSREPNYDGIEFSSHPASMSFYYKYAPGNGGDQYLAEIVIQHRTESGEIIEIGRGTKRDSQSISQYKQETVNIEYNENVNHFKPTHMYIVFKSGDKCDNSSFVTVPSFGNLSNGEYVGSQLYIDDIELIY